jgi:acetyl-CoA C-acetyltransferase
MPHEAVIVATARTPIGRANKGSLIDCRPDDLAAHAVSAALAKVPEVPRGEIEDLLLGCAQPAGESGFNMARVVAVLAGLPGAAGATINRKCASSLQAIRSAAHAIQAGEGTAYVAAGVETVSRFGAGRADDGPPNPRFAEAMERSARRAEGGGAWTPSPGLPDSYVAMGLTAENVRDIEGVTRSEMDEFAARSQRLAVAAVESGFHGLDIAPVTLPDGRVVDRDDCPRAGVTSESLAALKPVFLPDGEVTAGNACPLNDGAAAVVLMRADRAAELGIRPLARIMTSAVSGIDPEIMGLGPVEATRRALERAGLTIDDVDLVEINEAFAAQVIPSARRIGVDWEKLNVHGGAIALGHPFGMTGARIMGTLLHGLRAVDGTIGLETMCVGGGQGMATIVERLD